MEPTTGKGTIHIPTRQTMTRARNPIPIYKAVPITRVCFLEPQTTLVFAYVAQLSLNLK